MNYLPGTDGPQIVQGDIVNFKFKHCELSLRLPRIPYDTDIIDSVCSQHDWSTEDPTKWDDIEIGFDRELIHQSWKYRHLENREYVAMCYLKINAFTLNDINDDEPETLNPGRFMRFSFDLINQSFDAEVEHAEDYPRPENNFYLETIDTPCAQGIRFLVTDDDQFLHSEIVAILVLDKKMCLRVCFKVFRYCYTDSINPFSEAQMHQFKMDLFNEALAHLHLKYDAELLEQMAFHRNRD